MILENLYKCLMDDQELKIYNKAFVIFAGTTKEIPICLLNRYVRFIKADSYVMEVFLIA